jgi:hypothetical protein
MGARSLRALSARHARATAARNGCHVNLEEPAARTARRPVQARRGEAGMEMGSQGRCSGGRVGHRRGRLMRCVAWRRMHRRPSLSAIGTSL